MQLDGTTDESRVEQQTFILSIVEGETRTYCIVFTP